MPPISSLLRSRPFLAVISLIVVLSAALTYVQTPYISSIPYFGSDTDIEYGSDYVRHPHLPSIDVTQGTTHDRLNHQHLSELHACLASGKCGKNQDKVVLLAEKYFWEALDLGWRGGEHVWANSMMKALQQNGHTFLVSTNPEETLHQYKMFPDLVKVVIGTPCLDDQMCIKTEQNPNGIPRWKSKFDMMFFPWGGRSDGIGQEWVIRAERPGPRDPTHESMHYIGYSIEEECKKTRFVAQSKRPTTAWVYSKQATYFYCGFPEFGWNTSYFELAAKDLEEQHVKFIGSYKVDPTFLPERVGEGLGPIAEIPGIDNLGSIGPMEFAKQLSMTKVLVGVGAPWLAPSSYVALCLGTPFLNVVKRWNEDDPTDRTQWSTQHDVLAALDPPYVYNVHAGDYDGFIKAIQTAVTTTSVPPYIDPEMTEVRVKDRMAKLVERDWKALAEIRWAEQRDSGWAPDWVL